MKRISFNDEMMRAWLEGRKTVTRRLMKPQPKDHHHWDTLPGYEFEHKMMDCIDGLHCKFWHYIPGRFIDGEQWIRSPYSPGETVFIAERYSTHVRIENPYYLPPDYPDEAMGIHYWADGNPIYGDWETPKSPVTMPEWASRSKAIIKSIRPERVREITAPDIRNEGTPDTPHDSNCLIAERQSFIDLWDSLYPGSWERNDWVWRYGLERVG